MGVGSVVRLKSGGPRMVITCLYPGGVDKSYCCAWVTEDGIVHEHVFIEACLEFAEA